MAHSPGPWRYTRAGIGNILDRDVSGPCNQRVIFSGRFGERDRSLSLNEFDWHLIAAAPELLAYCKQLYVAVPNADLKRVIDKAEGREVSSVEVP